MSTKHDDHGFSANKIFWTLFILTAVEVAWSIVFKDWNRWVKWGGLLGLAFWKGALIYVYFMHMKFEGPVVKWLMRPTPVLMAVLVFALMPDVSLNDQLIYKVGSQLDKDGKQPGKVVMMSDEQQHGAAHAEPAEPAGNDAAGQ